MGAGSRPRGWASRLVRVAGWVLLSLVLVLATLVGIVRFWLIPQVDTFRPTAERLVGQWLDAPVRIGQLSAQWAGAGPRLEVQDITVLGPDDAPALRVDHASAALSWRSLVHWRPELSYLQADGIAVTVHRESDTVWWAAGRRLELGRREGRLLDRPAMRWLLRQPHLQVVDVGVTFSDATGRVPALTLTHGQAALQHDAFGETRFSVQADPPAGLGQGARVQGRIRRDAVLDADEWHGDVFAELLDADLAVWQRTIGLAGHAAGRVSGRTWVSLDENGVGRWSGDVAMAGVSVQTARVSAQVPEGSVHLDGDGAREDVTATLDVAKGALSLPTWFDEPNIPIEDLAGEVRLVYGGPEPVWRFTGLRGTAGEPERQVGFHVDGQWQRGGRGAAGLIDLAGHVTHADAMAVGRFMPSRIGPAVRRWLRHGILGGTVEQAEVVLRGDLADFPFDRKPASGEFRVAGRLAGVSLDVLPQRAGEWPRFDEVKGALQVERASLSAQVDSGVVRDGLPTPVAIGPTTVDIPSLHGGAVLTVTGEATGAAPAFLAYVDRSPVAGYTAGLLSQATATGEFVLPLRVRVPFARVADAEVEGAVRFNGNTIQLHPVAPPMREATGTVTFTQDSVGARQLRARWLGGAIRADGTMALRGGGAVRLAGDVRADAIQKAWPIDALGRLSGATAFTGELTGGEQGVALAVSSDLRGMAIDLPAPLDKPAGTAWPTTVTVRRGEQPGARLVEADVADTLHAIAEFVGGDEGLLPRRLGLGLREPARLPASGMQFDVTADVLDVARWQRVFQTLVAEEGAGSPAAKGWADRAPWRVQLRAARVDVAGQRFDDARVQAERGTNGAWQARLQARQVDGNVRIDPGSPGAWHARLARLMIEPSPAASSPAADAPPDTSATPVLPDIDLQVDRLGYHGRELGALQLAADNVGTDGRRWHVRELRLTNDSATLTANGTWEPVNGGTRRRTTLEVALDVQDAGALLTRLGFDGVVAGGSGQAKGSVGWAGPPFAYDVAGLEAHVGVALDHGRFLQTNNTAGRLLGILSLQTLARTATFQEGNLFAAGFAWDTLRSEWSISRGTARVEGFRLHGASATVALSGQADLLAETADLRAVIVPQVDASGAAVLAGLAINPVLGAGAFLAQWMLQRPLSDALTMQYTVTGPWREPDVRRVDD